jgi:hypothetical protein
MPADGISQWVRGVGRGEHPMVQLRTVEAALMRFDGGDTTYDDLWREYSE